MTWPFRPHRQVNPPPAPGYWALLDTAVLFGSPDSTLHAQTDVPVNCALMFSASPPSAIPHMRKTRGVWKRTSTSWRIAPGSFYWQNEPGDTLRHSWTVTGWPPGLALWWYLDAYQRGGPTVSKSILLNSVRPDPGALASLARQPLSRLGTAPALLVESPSAPAPSVA